MSPAQFNALLRGLSFAKFDHPLKYPTMLREVEGRREFVIRDNVRGSAWRLYLGYNCLPLLEPQDAGGPDPIEAESPWFNYVETDEKEQALESAWEFFKSTGLAWLENPYRLTHDEWIAKHKMLIRKDGHRIVYRPPRRLP